MILSHLARGRYSACIVGVDYQFLHTHKVYKQILFQTVHRAHALGAHTLDLGFTTALEKRKVGARPCRAVGFVSVDDLYAVGVLESLRQEKVAS